MNDPFGASYASGYDLFYADKDYDDEVGLIQRTFEQHSSGRLSAVLDLGCGTGNHALRLAERGCSVTGLDRSPAMLSIAREKAVAASIDIDLIEGDVRDFELGKRFDLVISMFAVMGYQTADSDLKGALTSVRDHLEEGGLFLFDVWFGPAVLVQQPGERFRVLESGSKTLIRASSGILDIPLQVCDVVISTWEIEEGKLTSSIQEKHSMRYFFPQELRLLLERSGFELLDLLPFPSGEGEPDDSTWNVFAVARAR
jgi:SAM-dependent methyltransferase